MKIKKPKSQEFLDIYSAILKFTKEKNGQVSKDMVRVIIRYSRRGPTRKRDLEVPKNIKDPLYVNTDNLNWTKYQGKPISVYHRRSEDDYINSIGISVHTNLCQRLEDLVSKVCFGNSK